MVHTLVADDVRPTDSTTLASAVAAFDGDIARMVEERVVPWPHVQRDPDTKDPTDDDDVDDDQGELTIGQLGISHGSDMSNATPVSWVNLQEKVRYKCSTPVVECRPGPEFNHSGGGIPT